MVGQREHKEGGDRRSLHFSLRICRDRSAPYVTFCWMFLKGFSELGRHFAENPKIQICPRYVL